MILTRLFIFVLSISTVTLYDLGSKKQGNYVSSLFLCGGQQAFFLPVVRSDHGQIIRSFIDACDLTITHIVLFLSKSHPFFLNGLWILRLRNYSALVS